MECADCRVTSYFDSRLSSTHAYEGSRASVSYADGERVDGAAARDTFAWGGASLPDQASVGVRRNFGAFEGLPEDCLEAPTSDEVLGEIGPKTRDGTRRRSTSRPTAPTSGPAASRTASSGSGRRRTPSCERRRAPRRPSSASRRSSTSRSSASGSTTPSWATPTRASWCWAAWTRRGSSATSGGWTRRGTASAARRPLPRRASRRYRVC